jgi:acyl-CoA thioester hydrolase
LEKKYNTRLSLTIDWADMDLFGHVNNVAFFRYMQSARVNYCEKIGLSSLNEAGRLSFMVASSQCRFKKPLHYPGKFSIGCRVEWVKNSSLQLEYILHDQLNEVVAEGEDVIVIFDHHKKQKVNIPDPVRVAINSAEGRQVQG